MKRRDDSIYVVFVKAHTGLGKITRKLTGYEYTHVAVSLDGRLKEFVTFSRRKHNAPFDAGFMREKREHYAFGKHKKVKVKIYKVPVQDFGRIAEFVRTVENDEQYIFNLYGMLTMPIVHGFTIEKSYNCMSFVAKILELTGVVTLQKQYYKYDLRELDVLLEPYFVKECMLVKEREDEAYMQKVSFVQNAKSFCKLNQQLIERIRTWHI